MLLDVESFSTRWFVKFDDLICSCPFTSSSTKPIAKLKKGVGQLKPPSAKLAVVKNTSSKLKRRSHRIAFKLEFSNTRNNLIEIEEAKEEVLMRREEIVFIDESKKVWEFLELRQGMMTVLEYVAKFIELARFSDDYVATDMAKVRKFEDGLKFSVRGKIVGLLL